MNSSSVYVSTKPGCIEFTLIFSGPNSQAPALANNLTPPCAACDAGLPEDEWLEITCGQNAIDAEYYGWNEELNEPIWLCQAVGIPEWAN